MSKNKCTELTAILNSLRGIGGNFVVLEEAAYINKNTFESVIAPILINDATLLALSTVGHRGSNFFNKLLKIDLFLQYRNSYVCPECVRAGHKDGACPHRIDSMPHWTSEGRMFELNAMMGEEGKAKFMMETLGLDPEEDETVVFASEKVDALLKQPRVRITRPVQFIFVCVDPCAGSKKTQDKRPSDFAIVTIAQPGNIILGMEAIPANRTQDYQAKLLDHINRIRANPYCKNARIVVDVETNSGFIAGDIQDLLEEKYGKSVKVIPMDDELTKQGRETNYLKKVRMAQRTKEILNRGDLGIWEHFVTWGGAQAEKDILKELGEQMCRFERVETETGKGNISVRYSGKEHGQRDDLSVNFQRMIITIDDFYGESKYQSHLLL